MVYAEGQEFVLADIPGLIEGAHEGLGLGDRFLGHIERCGVLLHLIDGTQEDVVEAYRTVRHEMKEYGGGLSEKTEIIGLNKCDALDEETIAERTAVLEKAAGAPVHALSGVSGEGVDKVLSALLAEIKRDRAARVEEKKAGNVAEAGDGWTP